MPEVFSVYNCGTSHNRQNLYETVADVARRTAGAENRRLDDQRRAGKLLSPCEQVGDGVRPGARCAGPYAGYARPDQRLKEGAAFAVIRGVVSGYGRDHNVDHTMAVLNATLDLPRTINMVGWSRGAITCFMIAHALNENRGRKRSR